jgi:hypothetical protein
VSRCTRHGTIFPSINQSTNDAFLQTHVHRTVSAPGPHHTNVRAFRHRLQLVSQLLQLLSRWRRNRALIAHTLRDLPLNNMDTLQRLGSSAAPVRQRSDGSPGRSRCRAAKTSSRSRATSSLAITAASTAAGCTTRSTSREIAASIGTPPNPMQRGSPLSNTPRWQR